MDAIVLRAKYDLHYKFVLRVCSRSIYECIVRKKVWYKWDHCLKYKFVPLQTK